jgi:pimeloyl-ACP methyl ester carboxylesterase
MKITHNGIQLNVVDTQVGDTALVFLHFWGGSSRTWSAVTSELNDQFRCVAIDARGAGGSDAPAVGYRTEDHAMDALAVIKELKLSRYFLVGHSMGGKAAQFLAATRPEGLLGVVLVASSPPSQMAIDETQRGQMRMAYADRGAIDWSLDNVLLGSPVADDVRRQLVEDASRLSEAAKAGWIETGTRDDFSAAVKNIEVPVVIIAGELDRVDPVAVVKEHILPNYPHAQLKLLPGKGHLLPVEGPAEVATIIRDFARLS